MSDLFTSIVDAAKAAIESARHLIGLAEPFRPRNEKECQERLAKLERLIDRRRGLPMPPIRDGYTEGSKAWEYDACLALGDVRTGVQKLYDIARRWPFPPSPDPTPSIGCGPDLDARHLSADANAETADPSGLIGCGPDPGEPERAARQEFRRAESEMGEVWDRLAKLSKWVEPTMPAAALPSSLPSALAEGIAVEDGRRVHGVIFRLNPLPGQSKEQHRQSQLEHICTAINQWRGNLHSSDATVEIATRIAYLANAYARELWPHTAPLIEGDTFLPGDARIMLDQLRNCILVELNGDRTDTPPRKAVDKAAAVDTAEPPAGKLPPGMVRELLQACQSFLQLSNLWAWQRMYVTAVATDAPSALVEAVAYPPGIMGNIDAGICLSQPASRLKLQGFAARLQAWAEELQPTTTPAAQAGAPLAEQPAAAGPLTAELNPPGPEQPGKQMAAPAPDLLEFIPGAFIYRNVHEPLTGKPWDVFKALANARKRTLTLKDLQDTVWPECTTGEEAVRSAVKDARAALRRAFEAVGVQKPADAPRDWPITAVERGKGRTAWRLDLP